MPNGTTFEFVTQNDIVAPTDQKVWLYINMKEDANYQDNIILTAAPSDPSIVIDDDNPDPRYPSFYSATITVPVALTGSIRINASRPSATGGNPDTGYITIEFLPYDVGTGENYGSLSFVTQSSMWQHPRNSNYPSAAAGSPLCMLTTTLTAADGTLLPDAEVHWSVQANSISTDKIIVRDSLQGGNEIWPVDTGYWYPTKTDENGVATIYVQARRTCQLNMSVETLGDRVNTNTGTTYFVDLEDPDPDVTIAGDPLAIQLDDGNYTLEKYTTSVTLNLPAVPPFWFGSENPSTGWLFTVGTISNTEDIPTTYSDMSALTINEAVRPPAVFFDINTEDTNPNVYPNFAVIYGQDPVSGKVYRSPYTQWTATGSVVNDPSGDTPFNLFNSPPYINKDPKKSNGPVTASRSFTNGEFQLTFDRPVQAEYVNQDYELYYIYYLGDDNYPGRAKKFYYPDWVNNADGLPVLSTNTAAYQLAKLDGKKATGFPPINGKYARFTCDYFVVKKTEREKESARIYSNWYNTLQWILAT